jgi:ABC-type dipeptide/oligopeptide/nickel transport system ATPase component
MENVLFDVQDGHLVIVVDLNQEIGESASGKSVIIATTGGNVSVPGYEQVKVGLNVYRPQQQASRGLRRMASR